MSERTCSVDGCTRVQRARGWCPAHWQRWQRYGDPLGGRTPNGAPSAFLHSVLDGTAPVEPNGCILWPYGLNSGYPFIDNREFGKSAVGAVVLARLVGPRPSDRHTMGHAAHEVCGSKLCVAPAHLSWQSQAEQYVNRLTDGTQVTPPRRSGREHSKAHPMEVVVEAIRRCEAGASYEEVGAALGVHRVTVWKWHRTVWES